MKTNKKLAMTALITVLLLVGIMFLPVVSAHNLDEATNDKIVQSCEDRIFVYMVQDFSNPISIRDIEETQDAVISNYKEYKRVVNQPMIFSIPEVSDDERIIAYGFLVNDDGITSQYVGIGDEGSVSKIQEDAKTWYTNEVLGMGKDKTNTILNTTSDSLNSKLSTSRASWSGPYRFYNKKYLSPYGGVMNNYELYVLSDDGSSTVDWFAVVQEFGMEPGYRAYPISLWKNDVGYAEQIWPNGNLGNAQLFSFRPNGPYTGQTSQSVTITGGTGGASAGLTWTYSQPDVSTECYCSTNTDIAKWKVTCNSNAAKTSTVGTNPGSTCSANQHSSGSYKILDVKATGIFRESLLSSKTLSTTSSPYISYS